MNKKDFLFSVILVSVGMLVLTMFNAMPVLAATFAWDIQLHETSNTTYTNTPFMSGFKVNEMIASGYMQSDGLDAVVTDGGNALPTLVSDNAVWWVGDLASGTTKTFTLTTGNDPASSMPIIVGSNGYFRTPYNASLELSDGWELDISGYVDTSSGSDKYILYKDGEVTVQVTGDEEITATVNDGSDESIVLTPIASGYYSITLILSSGTLTFTVGSTSDTTSVGTPSHNTNDWLWDENNAMPYIDSVAVQVASVSTSSIELNCAESQGSVFTNEANGTYIFGYGGAYTYAGTIGGTEPKWEVGGYQFFQTVNIPQGATITSATYSPYSIGNDSGTVVNTKITGYKIASSDVSDFLMDTQGKYQDMRGTVVGGANDDYITTAQVNWDNIPAWTAGVQYDSPDIASIIQELVNQSSWVSGDVIGIWFDDYNARSLQTSGDPWRRPSSMGGTLSQLKINYTYSGVSVQQHNDDAPGFGGNFGSNVWLAIQFIPSISYDITAVSLSLARYNGTIGNPTVGIRATPTGSDLCLATVSGASISVEPDFTWVTFTFNTPVSLSPSVPYFIVVRDPDAPGWSYGYLIGNDGALDNESTSNDSGASYPWSPDGASDAYRIYGSIPPTDILGNIWYSAPEWVSDYGDKTLFNEGGYVAGSSGKALSMSIHVSEIGYQTHYMEMGIYTKSGDTYSPITNGITNPVQIPQGEETEWATAYFPVQPDIVEGTTYYLLYREDGLWSYKVGYYISDSSFVGTTDISYGSWGEFSSSDQVATNYQPSLYATVQVPAIVVGTGEMLHYQPVGLISGTTLPDQSGNSNDGVITWGTNPAEGINPVVGGVYPINVAQVSANSTGLANYVIMPEISSNFSTTIAPAFPGADIITSIANATGTPPQLPFIMLASFVVEASSLTGSYLQHKFMTNSIFIKILIVTGVMSLFVALKVFDFWMLVLYLIIAITIGLTSLPKITGAP